MGGWSSDGPALRLESPRMKETPEEAGDAAQKKGNRQAALRAFSHNYAPASGINQGRLSL